MFKQSSLQTLQLHLVAQTWCFAQEEHGCQVVPLEVLWTWNDVNRCETMWNDVNKYYLSLSITIYHYHSLSRYYHFCSSMMFFLVSWWFRGFKENRRARNQRISTIWIVFVNACCIVWGPRLQQACGDGSKPWYLMNPTIAGKWMFIPLKMVLIGIDPYPCLNVHLKWLHSVSLQMFTVSKCVLTMQFFLRSALPGFFWGNIWPLRPGELCLCEGGIYIQYNCIYIYITIWI